MSKRQQELFPNIPSSKTYVSDYPELAAEWHPTKNKGRLPEDVLHGSNKKVWWRCNQGHEWQSAIFNRAMHGKGCPYCAGRKVSSTNNLLYRYPEVAKLWSKKNEIAADEVLARSGKMYIWECANGHEWTDRPHNMAKKKFHCPECEYLDRGDGLRKATPNFNLVTEYPELANEWHQRNNKPPTFYMPKSNDKVWWLCKQGHEWKANIDSRTRGNGCPYCSHKKPTTDYNLAVLHPELMDEWHPNRNHKTPSEYLPQSNVVVWWRCLKGHEWKAPIYRRSGGSGCPNCTNQTSKNELRIFTELAALFDNVKHRQKLDGLEVDIFLPDYAVAIEYDGKYWHREKAEQDKAKTKYLSDQSIKLLRIREAPLAKLQSHDIIIPQGSFISKAIMDKLVTAIGAGGHYLDTAEFIAEETYLKYLDYFPSPFPEHSLAAVNPTLAEEWHPTKNAPLTPENFTQSAKPKVWWMCKHGHEWKAAIYSRNLGGHACPYCAGFKATDQNGMAFTHPHMAELFHPTKNGNHTPETLKAGTGITLWWRCDLGHEWQQTGDKLKRLVIDEPCRKCRSLAVKYPDIAALWHPSKNGSVTPDDVAARSGVNRWWQCTVNSTHVWRASPNNMTAPNRKRYCPECK